MKDLNDFPKRFKNLNQRLSYLESNLVKMNEKIDKLIDILSKSKGTEHLLSDRAKTEQLPEQAEQMLTQDLQKVKGRHREILSLFVNEGFHTYQQIAERLKISQSRARAYVAELKSFGVPLRQFRDPEGYKIGIDVRFVEQILTFK
jgi:DNA-directed RNA polymerase specialized sigma subunit